MGVHPCKPLETKRNHQGLSKFCSPTRTCCAYLPSITTAADNCFLRRFHHARRAYEQKRSKPNRVAPYEVAPMNMTDYPHKLRSYYHNAAYQQAVLTVFQEGPNETTASSSHHRHHHATSPCGLRSQDGSTVTCVLVDETSPDDTYVDIAGVTCNF